MKALIIGGAGFVGKYLAKTIAEELKCDICVTKSLHHDVYQDDITFKNLDILDKDTVESLIIEEDPDYVFHLAAQSSIYQSWKNPAETVRVNVMGSLHVLGAIRQLRKKPVVIMVGSGEEYGIASLKKCPLTEDTLLLPQNIYAATKVCQNMMSSVYYTAYGINVIMVRAFNHVGPGQSDRFVISDFCHQVAKIEKGIQEPIINVGNLQAKRDFTDVRDVTRAYVRLAQFGIPGQTYNVGSGNAIAINEILNIILENSTAQITVKIDPLKIRPIDVPIIEADVSKIFTDTGWKPCISLNEMVIDMLNYWRQQEM